MTIKSVAIYARVSTEKQKVDLQVKELKSLINRRKWKLFEIYNDKGFTGANTKRPAYNKMMSDAKKGKFDILLVWKLDRLSRSVRDLINTLDELNHLSIDFISYENDLDTSSPTGKLVFHVIGAVAEFERDLIRSRVIAGLENARSKGKILGRPSKKSEVLKQRAKKLRESGMSYRKIAKKLNVSDFLVRDVLLNKKRD